jgi:hypothetical protein
MLDLSNPDCLLIVLAPHWQAPMEVDILEGATPQHAANLYTSNYTFNGL